MWILKVQGALWRAWIWDQVGSDVQETARVLEGEVRPRWTGWQVRAPEARVTWRGGAWGVSTKVKVLGRRPQQVRELLNRDAVSAMLGEGRS